MSHRKMQRAARHHLLVVVERAAAPLRVATVSSGRLRPGAGEHIRRFIDEQMRRGVGTWSQHLVLSPSVRTKFVALPPTVRVVAGKGRRRRGVVRVDALPAREPETPLERARETVDRVMPGFCRVFDRLEADRKALARRRFVRAMKRLERRAARKGLVVTGEWLRGVRLAPWPAPDCAARANAERIVSGPTAATLVELVGTALARLRADLGGAP